LKDQGEDGIRMDLREIGLGGVDWIRLAQDRDWWRAVVGDEPSGPCATELVNFIRSIIPRTQLLDTVVERLRWKPLPLSSAHAHL
jgi:hypothetical protein